MKCKQELCPNWSGDGNVCPCALFDLDTDATDPLPWDDPDHDPMQDIRDFIRDAEASYEELGHQHAMRSIDEILPEQYRPNPKLLPREEAVRLVAEQTGLPESTIAEYAARLKAVNPMLSAGAVVAQSPSMRRLMKIAADAEAAGIRAERGRVYYHGTDITPFLKVQYGPSQLPHNPANRRTFHLAGKPYHYVQTEDGLQTRPGESPWR